MSNTFLVGTELIKQYQEDGAIVVRNVFSADWIDKVKRGIQKSMQSPSPNGETIRPVENEGGYFNDYCNWRKIPEFEDYIRHSPAASIAAQLMQCDFSMIYHEHVLVKEPSARVPTPWHHDQAYYPINGEDICSIWMPVDPVPLQATVKFVKGSHAWNKCFFPRKFETTKNYEVTSQETALLSQYEDVPEKLIQAGKWEILEWECNPGDCVIFHGKTLHGADGNESSSVWRRVLSTRWLGKDATITSRPWDVSPPTKGGLTDGDLVSKSKEFPIIWINKLNHTS